MNNQDINDNNGETKNNVEIADANLLNPFQSNQNPNNSNTNVFQNSSENENLVVKTEISSNFNNNEIVKGVNQNNISNKQNFYQNNNIPHTNTIPVQTRIQENNNSSFINNDISNINKKNEMMDNNSFQNQNSNMQNSNNDINNENKNDKIINPLNVDDIGTSNDSKIEAKEDELKKISNNLNLDFLVLGIFSIIAFVYLISQGSFKITYITYIIDLAILTIGYIGSKNKKPYAAVCGFITGVFMIISGSIIDILLGIFIIIRSFKYNKILKKNGTKTKTLLYSILGIIGVVVITVAMIYFDLHNGHALKCTRISGETIEITFDSNGISNLKTNGKQAEKTDIAIYKLKFVDSFFFKGHSTDDISERISIYRNVVKEYEINQGSVCK